MKIDIKGEGVKSFKLEIKDFNLNERIDLNNLLYKFFNNNEGMFGPDEEINNYSNDEIFSIAISVSNFVNKKKVKK